MPALEVGAGGRERARDPRQGRSVRVWDPLVRLVHWGLALLILLNGAVTEEESALHEWIGYAALGLVAVRLAWGVVGPEHARFSAFPPNPVAALRHLRAALTGDRSAHLSHNPLGALMAYNLWATVIGLGVTGWMMGSVAFFGVDWVEEAHELLFDWLLVSVVLHVGGVLLDSRRTGVALVRAMIDGRKPAPAEPPA